MELWIRSQNKALLTKCEHLFIECYSLAYYITDANNEVIYGIYSTEEQAKSVLDDIFNKLNTNGEYFYTDCNNVSGYSECSVVYQMPPDEGKITVKMTMKEKIQLMDNLSKYSRELEPELTDMRKTINQAIDVLSDDIESMAYDENLTSLKDEEC